MSGLGHERTSRICFGSFSISPSGNGSFNRSVNFLRHELSEARVLEALWTKLFVGYNADHAFHVR
jgi:hypothetical protein